jgi:hypothetical protein
MPSPAPSPVTRIAANAATALFGIVILLQLLLAAGVLPVTMAWGGTQETLTPAIRGASVLAALFLAGFAFVIRRRAGLVGNPPIPSQIKMLSWFVTGAMALNTMGNLASQSMEEKAIFAPITILLTVACAVVSFSKTGKNSR